MTAIFIPQGNLLRATGQPGGPGRQTCSATTALMVREVERLAEATGFAVCRLTFDPWRPAGLRAFRLETEMLRDGPQGVAVSRKSWRAWASTLSPSLDTRA